MAVLDKIGADAALIGALPIAVAVFGEDGRLRLFNDAYAELFGLDAAWLAGHPAHGDILNRLREARRWPEVNDFKTYRARELARLKGLEKPESDQLYLPDGTVLKRIAAPLDGGFALSFEDQSPRLEAERALNEIDAVQRQTLDHINVAIAVYGADGQPRLTNKAFVKLWALEDIDLSLGGFLDATRAFLPVNPDWAAKRDRLVTRLLGRETGVRRLQRSDGRILDAAHIPLPDGAALISYTDVTDSAQVEEALRERANSMEAANKMKSEFLANLSHQVRNPLTAVIGFSELLSGEYVGQLNKRQMEYATAIAAQSEALASLFAAILDLASIEAGLTSLETEPVDLHAALAETFAMLRERARAKKITLEFDCSPDIGWIEADPQKLKQTVLHLLGNAVNYTSAGGRVSLAAARRGEWIEILIADTGVGMARGDIERLTAPFERGADNDQPGAGLGLTLVDRFVALHGGEMKISSAPSRGTKVTCRLPAIPNEAP